MEDDDIEADIKAAIDGASDAPAPETPKPAPDAPDTKLDAPVRDEHGKFALKAEKTNDAAPPQATEAQAEPIRAPEGLSAPVKAMWATLPREVQQDIDRREREFSKGIQERGERLNQVEPIAKALEPVQHQLAMAGIDGAAFVRAMVSADQQLRGPNKVQAYLQLGQQYGIQLPQGVMPGAPQQAQAHPQITALQREINELKQAQFSAQQQTQVQQQQAIQSTIDTFKADPANLYFENVKGRVAALLSSGQASDLKEAYDMACWADPVVRPLLIAEQTKSAGSQDAERAKAAKAKLAGGSVIGAPGAGGSPAARAPSNSNSVEDDVREAFASLRA